MGTRQHSVTVSQGMTFKDIKQTVFVPLMYGLWEWAYPDYENPFDEREAKPTDGAVATRNGVGQAEGQAESDPVKEEGHC